MIVEFCAAGALAGVIGLVYLAFFWKINWIRDLTAEDRESASLSRKYVKKNRQIGRLPPVYPNGWFGLLESTALTKGQVEHVAALGHNFAVFRTERGAVRIIDAYCPHLGANMAEGGQVKGEELECPFHSWRFCGETGKCTSIPYSKTVPTIKTNVWDNYEANGIIFVWHHAESISPNWWPRPIEKICNGTWKYQGRNEFYANCHIQEIPENGADWAHLSAVHGPSMINGDLLSNVMQHSWSNASWSPAEAHSRACSAKDPFAASGQVDEEPPEDEQHHHHDNHHDAKKAKLLDGGRHVAKCYLRHDLVFFERFRALRLNVEVTQIGPGYVELQLDTAFGPMCIVQTVTPLRPLLQRVVHLIYAPLRAAPYSRIVMVGESIMFQRDLQIWNHKKYMENPRLVREDRTIQAYRRWYRQFYSEHSPTYEMACAAGGKSLEW